MVIQYQGRGQNATCKPTSIGSRNKDGEIYWQVLQGTRTEGTSWFVDTHKDWDPRPVCTATFKGIGTCQKHLDFTLYSMYCHLILHFHCQQLEMWPCKFWTHPYLCLISPETPDSVSIRPVDNLSSVVEEREVQLQCDITNVAPARKLTVRWYQGNETLAVKGWEIFSLHKFLPFLWGRGNLQVLVQGSTTSIDMCSHWIII